MSRYFSRFFTLFRRVDRLFVSIVVLSAIVRLGLYLGSMRSIPLSGDERFYFSRSAVILRLIHSLCVLDFDTTMREGSHLVGDGWFLPGMSLLLAPARLITDNHAMLRAYVGGINFFLFVSLAVLARHVLPRFTWAILLIVLSIVPAFIVFTFMFWGEAIAGQLLLIVLLMFYRRYASPHQYNGRHYWFCTYISVSLVAIIYTRSSFLFVAPVTILGIFCILNRDQPFWRAVRLTFCHGGVMILFVLCCLLPWSTAVSAKFGGVYLTTTTVDLQTVITFGTNTFKQERLREGDGNIWRRMQDYYVSMSQQDKQRTYAELVRADRKEVLSQISIGDYRTIVSQNISGMFLLENQFLELFQQRAETSGARRLCERLKLPNTLMWYLLLCSLFVTFLAPVTNNVKQAFLLLMSKAFFLAVAVMPFIASTHSRYYIGLVPLMAVLLALCLTGDIVRYKQVEVYDLHAHMLVYLNRLLLFLLVVVIVTFLL